MLECNASCHFPRHQVFKARESRVRVMHRLYRNARQVVLGLLFPPVCMNCNQELAEETCENGLALPFCTDCLFEMPIYAAPFCIRCGCGSILQNVDGCRACAAANWWPPWP